MNELPDNVVRLADRRGKLNIVADTSGLYSAEVKAVVIEHYSHYQAMLYLQMYLQNGVRFACPEVILRVIPEPPPEPPPEPEPFRPVALQGEGKPSLWSRVRGLFRSKPKRVP